MVAIVRVLAAAMLLSSSMLVAATFRLPSATAQDTTLAKCGGQACARDANCRGNKCDNGNDCNCGDDDNKCFC